ncbi:TPA: DUF1382 family protein [Klebsiella pneumoniae]
MNRASPVDLRKCLEAAHGLAHIGIRFVPIPVATEEEFQSLSAELSRKLEQKIHPDLCGSALGIPRQGSRR